MPRKLKSFQRELTKIASRKSKEHFYNDSTFRIVRNDYGGKRLSTATHSLSIIIINQRGEVVKSIRFTQRQPNTCRIKKWATL